MQLEFHHGLLTAEVIGPFSQSSQSL